MKNQLQLTVKELEDIGFKVIKYNGDEMNVSRKYYKIKTLNGYFYYNPNESVYTWYHKTVIGEVQNDYHLDIQSETELLIVLSAFKVKLEIKYCMPDGINSKEEHEQYLKDIGYTK